MPKTSWMLASWALLAAALSAQTYKNDAGFSLTPPDKWTLTPVALQDKDSVAKWVSKIPIHDLPAEMVVMQFKKTVKKAVHDEADSKPSYRDDLTITSYEKFCSFAHDKWKFDKPVAEVAVKGTTAKARVFHQTVENAWSKGAATMNAWFGIALIDTPQKQFAIEVRAADAGKDKLGPMLLEVVKSFRVLEAADAPATEEEHVAGLSEKEQAKRTAEIAKRQAPGWWYKETPHYVILTDVKPDRAEIIDLVKARIEQLRKVYERDFPPAKPVEAVSIVRICANEKQYYDYGAPHGSAGYWLAFAQELVLYAGGEKKKTLAVLNHEAFHQYIYYAVGEIHPHDWYNEGHGDYYAGATPEGADLKIKPFDWRTGVIKSAIGSGKFVPMEDFIKYSHHQYYADAELCYAEGWSLIWFLRRGLPDKHPWKTILPTYFDALIQTKNQEQALAAAWKGVDMKAFEQAWGAFIVKGTMPALPKD
jgi:hypothetical protein